MSVCLFSIEIQTAGQIWMKFGIEVVLRGVGFDPVPPPPAYGVWGASGASAMHFGEYFIKQKLQGTPDLVRAGHIYGPQIWIQKDLGPCPSGAMVTHYEGEFITQKL